METGHDQRSLEWCFVGSLMVLAIPVLTVAYPLGCLLRDHQMKQDSRNLDGAS